MMDTSSKRLLASIVLVVVLHCLGCKKAEVADTAEVAVEAEKATIKPLTEYVSADTVLGPQAQAAIVPKISAPIRAFYVQRGTRVTRGQLLVSLENADLTATVKDTGGALEQADAAYVSTTKASIVEDHQKAALDVAQAKANLEVAQSLFDSRSTLLEQGAIPRRDLETARASLVQAKAAADIAEQHLRSLDSVSQASNIKNAEGARASAQGKYEAARAGLGYSEVKSPIDGVVTDRPLFAGEMANAGQAIVTVMDVSTLIAKVHLSQDQAKSIIPGAEAMVTPSSGEEPTSGKVTLISPALDTGSTTLEVWISVPNKKGTLRAGTPVHVSIASQEVSNALSIPNESVINGKGGELKVLVVGADGIAHQKPIKVGITDGHDTQVLSGLREGDLVISKGAYGLDDGTKVKVGAPGGGDDEEKPAAGTPAGGEK